jgi:hypothetical protein
MAPETRVQRANFKRNGRRRRSGKGNTGSSPCVQPHGRTGMCNMLRRVFAVAVLAAVPSTAAAQDFSGEWALIDAAGGSAAWASPIGDRGSIVHAKDTITIRPAQPRSLSQGERTYRLDGSETQYDVRDAAGAVRRHAARLRRVSTALVITTTSLPMTPTENAWDSMMTLSLNGMGQLELLTVGPNLWPSGTSYTQRFIYQKSVR